MDPKEVEGGGRKSKGGLILRNQKQKIIVQVM